MGCRLSERRLALEFSVSRSPIREALKLLQEKGLLGQGDKQGYPLLVSADAIGDEHAGFPASATEELYLAIARDRFAMLTQEQFTEAEFMRRYKSSRGSLQKVLIRMSGEGLVQRLQGHGWRFLPLINTKEAYQASYDFRELIEPAALLTSTFKIEEPRFSIALAMHRDLVSGLVEDLIPSRLFQIDSDFHEMLGEFSGNIFLLQAIQQQNVLRRLVEYESYTAIERMRESCEEHLAVLTALKDGDNKFAAELMRRHMRKSAHCQVAFFQATHHPPPSGAAA